MTRRRRKVKVKYHPDGEISRTPRHGRKVNFRFLRNLLLALAVSATAVVSLHAFQVERNARSLLALADLAEGEENTAQALHYLVAYLAYAPRDDAVRQRYGRLLDKAAANNPLERQKAFDVLDQVARRQPDNVELRRQVVQMALDLERYKDAGEHLDVLLQLFPNEGRLEFQMGRCCEGRDSGKPAARDAQPVAANELLERPDLAQAREWYGKAIADAPDLVDAYFRLANLLRRFERTPVEADRVMDAVVKANEGNWRAHLARAAYKKDHGLVAEAARSMAQARKLAPEEADVLLGAGELAQARGEQAEARKHLNRAIELHPEDVRPYKTLAQLELGDGRHAEAVDCLHRALASVPGHRPDLLWMLTEVLLTLDRVPEAQRTIARLRELPVALRPVDYLDGIVLVKQEQWLTASRVLERVRPFLRAAPYLVKQADLYLAQCYEHLGNLDLQLAAYNHALSVEGDRDWLPARIGMAAALRAAGRFDEAATHYGQALSAGPRVRLELAKVLFARTLRRLPNKRNWDEVTRVLESAARQLPDDVEVPLLRAEILAARNDLSAARLVLEGERRRRPREVAVWTALATAVERQDGLDKALALLTEAQQKLGDRSELRLARARLLVGRPGAVAAKTLRDQEEGLERFPEPEQVRFLRGLAEAHYARGNRDEAGRLWERLTVLQPTDLRSRLLLFDLAREKDDEPGMERILHDLRQIEGDGGTLWRYGEAARLLLRARKSDERGGLAVARQLLTEIAVQRPTWARVPLLAALIDEEFEDAEQAIDHYQRAVHLGERDPPVVRRLVQLLAEQRRYREAEQALAEVRQPDALPGDLQRLAAEMSLQNQEYDAAVKAAEKAVEGGSREARDHVWLGQVYWLVGKREQAERALERAVQVAGDSPLAWIALVQFLARTDQRDKADKALQQAERKLPPAEAPLTLGQCCERLGRLDKAEEHYRAALAARPDDLAVLRVVADFYQRRNQFGRSQPLLRAILDPKRKAAPGDVAWARRNLALGLAAGDEYQEFLDALQLIEINLQARTRSFDDLRARAVILATRPSHRQEALRTFEGLQARRVLSAEEQFLMAQLYDEAGDWRRARERFLALMGEDPDNPLYLTHYARHLIAREEPEEAQRWLERVERLEPESFRVLELRLRLLKARRQEGDVAALTRAYARGKDAANLELVAGLLDDLGLAKSADDVYRDALANSKRPESLLVLIKYLLGQKRVAEALDLCERAWTVCGPEQAARASVAALRAERPTEARARRVEQWLKEALRKHGGAAFYQFRLAEVYDLLGRQDDAEAVYRQVLDKDANDGIALNNLAWLLAQRPGREEEALGYVNRAIQRYGPAAQLLDTRGVIYLAQGRLKAAAHDLQESAKQVPAAATYFHLALAHFRAGNRGAAADAFRKARDAALTAQVLHPLERPAYSQLLADLDTTEAPPPGGKPR
jgi:tetratricopeptide (TPR) repeat protein